MKALRVIAGRATWNDGTPVTVPTVPGPVTAVESDDEPAKKKPRKKKSA